MKLFFEILKKEGIITRKCVNSSKIENLSITKIIDLAQIISNSIEESNRDASRSIFRYSASSHLSGGRDFCDSLDCRIQRLDELARFATLYSDQVYIHNFFSDYKHFTGNDDEIERININNIFYQDVYLINRYKILFEEGFFTIFTSPEHICEDCLANSFLGHDAEKKLLKGCQWLANDIFQNTSLLFEFINGEQSILRCVNSRDYFDHGELSQVLPGIPQEVASKPRIMSQATKGKLVFLGQNIRKSLHVHNQIAEIVTNNIAYEIAKSQSLNTTLLTNKSFFPSFLNASSSNSDLEHRNLIAMKYLSSIVPFSEDIELKELIKLRNRESLSFVNYRKSLNEAIDELRSSRTVFTEREARVLYSDVVAPNLASLEISINDAKKHLRIQPIRSSIALAGVLSFGFYSGFIPADMIEIVKLLGLGKVAIDLQKEILALSDADKNIRNEGLYFLWKVQEKSKTNK